VKLEASKKVVFYSTFLSGEAGSFKKGGILFYFFYPVKLEASGYRGVLLLGGSQ